MSDDQFDHRIVRSSMWRALLLPLALVPAGGALRVGGSKCLTWFTLDGTVYCSMDQESLLELEKTEDAGWVERRVQESCATAGLSSKDCAHLTSATIKSVGEELAWRRGWDNATLKLKHPLDSREDAIEMLSGWGWGKSVWLFGDSHMRKMTRTLLRILEADSETRQVVGNHEDCGIEQQCWCPTIFRIFKDSGRVERMRYNRIPTDEEKAEEQEESGWKVQHPMSSSSFPNSITLIFRYFVVRRDDTPSASYARSYGTYDRPCVYKESAASIAETIRQWKHTRISTALLDPDVIIFNAGNWESNEEWDVGAFEQDVRRRAEALQTAFLPTSKTNEIQGKKLIFLGPPFFDDRVSHLKECPNKWAPHTSSKVAAFSQAAVRSLRKAGVTVLDTHSMTKHASSEQFAFWQALDWAGGVRYELCSNHQTPAMYRHFWQMLTELVSAKEKGNVNVGVNEL